MRNFLFRQLICLISVFCCCTIIPEKEGYADVTIPAKEDLAQKFQIASHAFTDNSDSFFISILTSKIETLVPDEENISYQIRTVLARQQQQWLARTEVLDHSGSQSKKTEPYFELFLTKDGQVLQWTSDNITCQIRPFSESNIYLYWDYPRYLGLNVYKSIAESNNISYDDLSRAAKSNPVLAMLNDLFINETLVVNADQYTVHPIPEKIDGFDCWIVEWAGMDKMWIVIECLHLYENKLPQ
jgi:hypothetical protein